MAESDRTAATEEVTAAELAEIITELQKYRDRLVHETTEAIQKARLPKAKAMAQMEPELIKIDAMMQELHDRHAALASNWGGWEFGLWVMTDKWQRSGWDWVFVGKWDPWCW